MRELGDLLARHDESVPLDVAALQMATIEYPEISVEPFQMLLDSYARELGERVTPEMDGEEFVGSLTEYLFDELGFEGNEDDYYDPSNSCLNEVLTRRTGIPITLSVVCIEIARRLDRRLYGIGLPGHFLLQYDDSGFQTYIDPFNNGQLLLESDCYDLARRATGIDLPDDPALLQRVSKRQILMRMLGNLRNAYLMREEPTKILKVLDLLIAAEPNRAEEYRQRGLCRARMHLYQPALADLRRYLDLEPAAEDSDEIRKHIDVLASLLKRLQ